jgi:uncharacterized damage-inducible protein DinB
MNIVIRSSIATLQKSSNLLTSLTNDVLCDVSVPPYFSCIGSHIRHILDFYDCILEGLAIESVDLTKRKRDEKMHSNCQYARANVQRVMENLQKIGDTHLTKQLIVKDDLGLGITEIPYTLGGLLAQANSHAIHHYAIINFILDRLGVHVNDDDFGYNPTTPKPEINLN